MPGTKVLTAASLLFTYICDLGIMSDPGIRDAPAIILAIPNLDTMVRRGCHHPSAIEIVVYGQDEIAMAMTEALVAALCSHWMSIELSRLVGYFNAS